MRTEDIARLGIGHVPEGRGVIGEFTVEENLRLGAMIAKVNLQQGLEEQYEQFPVLGERRKQHAAKLSGGERQMLAMARALIAKPSVLLLDEPSLGLAPLVTAQLMHTIHSLCETSDLTVILVEQNASSALRIAHHAVVLHVGKVVANDAASNVAADDEPPSVLPRIGGVMDPFLTSRVVTDILGGLTNGVIYGMVALSLVLIWRSTGILNFAQGAMPMFATYVGFALLSYHLGLLGLRGRVRRRRIGDRRADRAAARTRSLRETGDQSDRRHGRIPHRARSGRGLYLVLDAAEPAQSVLAGRLAARAASRLSLSPFTVYEIATALVVMIAVAALFRFTKLGLQLRASALAPEVSRLLGVRVGRLLTLGWMLATVVGVITTILVASKLLLGPHAPDHGRHLRLRFHRRGHRRTRESRGRDRRRRLARHHQSIRR